MIEEFFALYRMAADGRRLRVFDRRFLHAYSVDRAPLPPSGRIMYDCTLIVNVRREEVIGRRFSGTFHVAGMLPPSSSVRILSCHHLGVAWFHTTITCGRIAAQPHVTIYYLVWCLQSN